MAEDPYLGAKRNQLVVEAATRLANARMITFDRMSGGFTILDLGRIAAKYYIRHASIEIFNQEFRLKMTEADVLKMLCMSTEVRVTSCCRNATEKFKLFSSIKYKSGRMKSKSSRSCSIMFPAKSG